MAIISPLLTNPSESLKQYQLNSAANLARKWDILTGARTDDNLFKDIKNKIEVINHTSKTAQAGSAIRQDLYDAYKTGGYTAFRTLKDKYYSKTPQVYESDLGAAGELHNARYRVNTVRDYDTAAKVQQSIANGTLEMRILDERGTRNAYDTAYGTRNMGREKLVGINDKDRYVLYDRTTGQYFRYRNEDDADYQQLQEDLEAYEKLYDAQVAHLASIQSVYLGELNKATGARYAKLYEEYANKYTEFALKANETANKLVELRAEVNLSEDTKAYMDADMDKYEHQRLEYNKYNKYIADFNDPYQFNSIADLAKELFNDTDKKSWFENLGELWHYNTAYLTADELTGGQKAMTGLQNVLVNLGETMDIVATPVKALINGPSQGMSRGEAFKASMGWSEGGGYYNFDYDTGWLPVDLLLEVLSDPTTYASAGYKAIADVAAGVSTKAIKEVVTDFGIDATDELLDTIGKVAMRNARVSGKPVEEALRDATVNVLAKQDVHKKLVSLGDETLPFLEADRAAKVIIDGGYLGHTDKTMQQLYKALSGTNLSPMQIDRVLKLSGDSWNLLNDTAEVAAKTASKQKALRVMAAAQRLDKLDDVYARTVRKLTATPFTIPLDGVNWISKQFTGHGASTHLQNVITNLWSTIKRVDTANPVTIEKHLLEIQDVADTTIMYAKEIAESNEVIEELTEVQQRILAQQYNAKVSKIIDAVEFEVKIAVAGVDYSTLTKADVYKIFEDAVRKVTGGVFDFAQLYSFTHVESAFAKFLNDANKNAYKQLSRMRTMLSERVYIGTAQELFKNIGNAIERLNKVRTEFNTQYGNDIPLKIAEDTYNTLEQLLHNAEFGEETLSKLRQLEDNVHDLRWFVINEGTVPDDLKMNMYMTLDEINKDVVSKFAHSVDLERTVEMDEDVIRAFGLDDPSIVQYSTLNDTVTAIRKLFEKADAEVSEEELNSLIIKELDKHKLANTDEDWMRISVSNVARKLAVYSNPFINKAINAAVDVTTPLGKVIDTVTRTVDDSDKVGYAIKHGASTMYTYRMEQELLNKVNTGFDSITGLAIQDTLADEVLKRANGLVANMDSTSAASIELTSMQITNQIIGGVQEHLQGVSEDYAKSALVHNFDDAGNYFTLNGVDTEQNVRNMMTASSDLLNKGREIIADDNYRDVYYSITHLTNDGDPIRISFGDSVTGEIRTYTFGISEGALNISDDTARKMFGLNDAREFKEQMLPLLDGAYDNTQDYYTDINKYLSTVLSTTHGGKQVRFIGFNSGVTRTRQERVFKSIRNRYNTVSGPFIDLGEEIRKVEFPQMFLADADAQRLEDIVREHVNEIARAQMQQPNIDLRFGNTAEDLTHATLALVADDALRFSKGGVTKDIPSMAISNMLDNTELPLLYNQAQDVKKALVYARATVKKLDVPDDVDTIVNMSRLKELYELKVGQKLNVMEALRKTQGKDVNIRYVYRADEAKRWFKTDAVKVLNAQQLDGLHRAYKHLISYEQRIKETHVAEMFRKQELVDMYRLLFNRLPKSAKYDAVYPALKMLDTDKMSNNQMLAVIFAVRKFVGFTDEELDQMTDLMYLALNHRAFLSKGLDIVKLPDMARYNKFNTLQGIYSHTLGEKFKFDRLYDDVRVVESYIRLLDRNYGRSTEGLELAAMQNLSRGVKKLADDYDDLRTGLYWHAVQENGTGLMKSKELEVAEGRLREFMDKLDEYSATLTANTVLNLSSMTPEQFKAHLISNCSGTLVLQLDSAALSDYVTATERLVKTMGNAEGIELAYKELNVNGVTHPVAVFSTPMPNSSEVITNAMRTIDELLISVDGVPNKELVENLPNRFLLSDYTPANAAATMRVLEFAGKSTKEANDIVQIGQRHKMFDAGCNNNVIGDHAFVKQFYPEKASNYMKTTQQMVMHNMNRIGGLTYYTSVIKSNMFSLDKFIKGTTHKQLIEITDKYGYVVCKLTDDGRPVKVALTRGVYNDARHYACVPEEWFKEMETAYDAFKSKNVLDNRNSLQYKLKAMSTMFSDVVNLRKQTWLFTNTATPINNFVGGATNFVSDTGFSGARALLTNTQEYQIYQRVYRDLQQAYGHIDDNAITQYYKTGTLRDLMDEDTFRNHLQIAWSSGSVSDESFVKMLEAQPEKLANEAVKYANLVLTEAQHAEFVDYIKLATVDMNKIFDRHYDRVNGVYDYVAIQKSLNEYLNNSSSVWAEYLQPVAMQFMSKQSMRFDITKIPVLGKYYQFNQNMFSGIESYIRDTVAMYYMQHGEIPRDAINHMLRTQFDYSDAGAFMKTLNAIMPFSTYKLMNLNYWLFDKNTKASAIRLAANLGTYQGIVDPMELARSMYWANYYAENPDTEETEEEALLQQLTRGTASNEMYVSRSGKWKISKNHYLKNSAPFFEASELWTQVFVAMTDYEAFKQFIADNLYSPFTTTATFLDDLFAGNIDENYYAAHYYEINDMVPVLGAIVNSIIGKVKAAKYNFGEISAADFKALYAFGPEATQTTMDTVLDMLAVTWSSMIGTTKDIKPIGYNWNEQSEEYKATHRFVYGVSVLPSPIAKDPVHYVNHLGRLVELGYTKEEALDLLTKGWYFDADGNVHQYKIYEDEEMPDLFKYDADMFDNTLKYLLEQGHDIDSAYTYMKTFGRWVDDKGNVRGMDDVELLWKNSLEKDRYFRLPAYIRNIPSQYSKQLAYYRSLGYESDEAKLQMHFSNIFIADDGSVVTLTPEQIAELNARYKYNMKYQKDAEAAQSAEKYTGKETTGAGKFHTFKTPETIRTEGGRRNQASSYPARYRRPKKIRHSFTYDSIYGINNIARNRMDVAMSHTHYRSANRYRAEAVRNRFRYL